VHLVGFTIKKFVTMHRHMNVKFELWMSNWKNYSITVTVYGLEYQYSIFGRVIGLLLPCCIHADSAVHPALYPISTECCLNFPSPALLREGNHESPPIQEINIASTFTSFRPFFYLA
jgi:hypothetical protein